MARLQRPLPLRCVARPCARQVQAAAEPLGDVARGEERHPRCRDLDPQREPVEAAADLRHGVHVLGRQAIAGPNARCPILEQADRVDGPRVVDRQPGWRHAERRHRELLFAGDPQRRAAGDDNRQVGRRAEQAGEQRRRVEDLLDVVDDDGERARRQEPAQPVVDRFRAAAGHEPERCGEDARDELGVMDRLERDEPRAVPEPARFPSQEFDRQGSSFLCRPGRRG